MNFLSFTRRLDRRSSWIAMLVALHGLIIIADTLVSQLGITHFPQRPHDIDIVIDLPLLLGLTLLYTSLLLRRRKRNAWMLAVALYIFLLGLNTESLLLQRTEIIRHHLLALLLPLVLLAVLLQVRKDFVVRSDTRTFANSVRVAVIGLMVAFLYGVVGFLLMDRRDFHQEVSLPAAMHYTIDQFALTTEPLHAYTRRAHLFQGSLSFISISAAGFVFISLFQPLRSRYAHHKERAALARYLIHEYPTSSQDFFKLWPPDKEYLFSNDGQAGVAYKVRRGVALGLGDPFGRPESMPDLLERFEELCFVNDWLPAFVQATPRCRQLFSERGYRMQPIGQEAIVDLEHFEMRVAKDAYFRNITNKFKRLGFSTELLRPPHSTALVDRLRVISDEWLTKPGRAERGFTLGYFNEVYLQTCPVFVARDAAGTIQAFVSVVASPLPHEATLDLIRGTDRMPNGCMDYLLREVMIEFYRSGMTHLDLGLCPLAGLEDQPNTLSNRTLRFVYSNGSKLFSFKGLYAFKAKYRPAWAERYEVYKGSVREFTRVLRALNKAMRP